MASLPAAIHFTGVTDLVGPLQGRGGSRGDVLRHVRIGVDLE